MARVKVVNKSRKEYKCGSCGKVISVGSSYQSIKMMYNPIRIRCMECGFKRWETVSSEYLKALYEIQDTTEIKSQDDLDMLISSLQDLADETREKFDNMPEGLQQGDSGQILETRADSLDDAISDLENMDEFPDDLDVVKEDNEQEDDESDEEYEERMRSLLEELQGEFEQEIMDIISSIEE